MYLKRKRVRTEEQEIDNNNKGIETLSQALLLGYI